ncbi:ABC transporter ATP-binding protein [Spirulina sp. CS-785/01]|uniref:ABC transporter ATP-binding protein n=1 Tax=Spirulina sp. CS-785/01 TaxID=3021716 RepID=UPI00232D31D2|nr:ABC transporter ATP-binding protein [Spirulina sp. CS-785/01]MDB9314389.1 ABC transporter ATP-binding protein [Spirulina sp. CS-785/01]
MENNIVLQTNQLQKEFGGMTAVNDVSLKVRRGDVFGFLGPNGAGKTTTIAMILGLLRPTQGEVRVFGETVTPTHHPILRQVGALVGASPALVPHLSARENLQLMARLYPDLPKNRVDEVLEFVGLAEVARRPPRKFSTGMKQRLGMALAILHQPQLLILDEPTNGMDPGGMQEIRRLIQRLAQEGVTIFLSSHLLYEVEQVCNAIAILNQGKLMTQGTLAELQGEEKKLIIRAKNIPEILPLLKDCPQLSQVEQNAEEIMVWGAETEQVLHHLAQHSCYPSELFYARNNLENFFLELTQDN